MLWVRSQDNTMLINVTCVRLLQGILAAIQGDGIHTIVGYEASARESFWVLGEYSSEEKAIRVLDMMEMTIKGTREYTIVPNGYPVIKDRVFQMPADEEVEVD